MTTRLTTDVPVGIGEVEEQGFSYYGVERNRTWVRLPSNRIINLSAVVMMDFSVAPDVPSVTLHVNVAPDASELNWGARLHTIGVDGEDAAALTTYLLEQSVDIGVNTYPWGS